MCRIGGTEGILAPSLFYFLRERHKRNNSFMLKKKLLKLELKNFLKRLGSRLLIKFPDLHKGAALIMLIPFGLQSLLQDIFVIKQIEFSLPKLFNSIPLLDRIDLSYIPFFDNEFVIESINYSLVILLPLFLLAVYASQWLLSKTRSKHTVEQLVANNEKKKTSVHNIDGLDNLNREVLPVWNRQIDSATKQSEVAVKELAKQFGGISRRLNEAIQASVSYSNDGVSNIGNRDANATGMISQQELAEMLDTLREAIDVKSVLLDKIGQLKEQTNIMKDIVSSVKAVSRRTEVLAINASIESRRAGIHGKSFGIVAQEVRKLSEQSETMVDDVGLHIHMLEQKMDEVIAQTSMNATGPQDLAQQSNKTMSLYERFRVLALSLSKSSEILLVESSNIKSEINEILVALQYQDKTSQILLHVTDDIHALHEFLIKNLNEPPVERLNVESWMEKLYSTYTMIEEKRAHNNDEKNEEEEDDDSSSLEFF